MDIHDIPVKITHFINPNRFYCCDLWDAEKIFMLSNIEKTYGDHCTKLLKTRNSEPKENDVSSNNFVKHQLIISSHIFQVVGYCPPLTGKWIRCTVDGDIQYNSLGERVAVLWAIDYGKPATTRFLQNLVPLPCEIVPKTNPIFHAGLAVSARNLC